MLSNYRIVCHDEDSVRKSDKSVQFDDEPSSTQIVALSDKLLLKIFANLSENELKKYVMPICRKWRKLARNPNLWKNLRIEGQQNSISEICTTIWKYQNLYEIVLYKVGNVATILRQICRCSPRIGSLTIRYCEMKESQLKMIAKFCGNLRKLDLKGSTFKAHTFYEDLARLPELVSVNLSGLKTITVLNILTVALNCKSLQEIYLSSFESASLKTICDDDITLILDNIQKNICAITLDCSRFSSTSINNILKCEKIKKLGIYYAYSIDGDLLANIGPSFNQLEELHIRYSHFFRSHHFIKLFGNGIGCFQHLKTVDLSKCSQFCDEGVKELANACPNLTTLILRSCKKITDLSPVLMLCLSLEVLNVAFCEKLKHDFLKPIKNLKCLFLDTINFNSYIEFVQDAYPEITIKICLCEFNKKFRNFSN